MEYIVIAVWTAVFTMAILLVYKYVINPQMIITPNTQSMAICPDRWSYNSTTGMCDPMYETKCLPFSPKQPNTFAAKCNIARSCGTTWSGFCG